MKLTAFSKKQDLNDKTQIEKVRLLAYYFLRKNDLDQFGISDVSEWFDTLSYPLPNSSRIRDNIKKSRKFIRGSVSDTYRLHAREIDALDIELPELLTKSEEIIAPDIVLPHALYDGTRGFIENISKQINASYDNNVFDGCAVLMRRLLEILLILSYENNGIEDNIKDDKGNYILLNKIMKDAVSNGTLSLSRNTKDCLDKYRNLGNFSAHKIYYNAKRSDLEKILLDFRAAVEELLYKSGIKV